MPISFKFCVTTLVLLLLNRAVHAQDIVVPAGSYQIAWLKLDKAGDDGGALPVFLGLRDGKATSLWFASLSEHAGSRRTWADDIALQRTGDAFRGSVKGRRVKIWPYVLEADFAIEIDAKVTGDTIAGSYKVTFTAEGKERKVTGGLTGKLITEEVIAKAEAFPAGKNWPSYYGADGAFRGPDSGVTMIDDLAKARPLWKSEEQLPCAWGNGPDSRYKNRVCFSGVTGGASSPVVADGLVYIVYYRPAGSIADAAKDPKLRPFESGGKPTTEAELRAEAAKITKNPKAQKDYLDWHLPLADVIIVALDATTGKIVWKVELRNVAFNFQTHKWRGFNPTPLVADGTLYVMTYNDRLYAFDARTGRRRWEYDKAAAKSFTASAVGPVLADGVIVISTSKGIIGVDAKTGTELWKTPQPGGVPHNLLLWRSKGTERVVACGGIKPFAAIGLDTKTGKALWQEPLTAWSGHSNNGTATVPLLSGDILVGFDLKIVANVAKGGTVFAYRLRPSSAVKAWAVDGPGPVTDTYGLTVGNGHVYVDGDSETFCLKIDSGEKVATVKNVGGARTQTAFFGDGRLFIQPEGRHGGQTFFMLNGDPKNFRLLPASGPATKAPGTHPGQWIPPHPSDTAYAVQAIGSPLVDGRLFVRGFDGIYCYDLRATGK